MHDLRGRKLREAWPQTRKALRPARRQICLVKTFVWIVFWTVMGGLLGNAIGKTYLLLKYPPAPAASYVWDHFAMEK